MNHLGLADHDPLFDHAECEICNAALRRTFNRIADQGDEQGLELSYLRDLSAEEASTLADGVVNQIREILSEEYGHGGDR